MSDLPPPPGPPPSSPGEARAQAKAAKAYARASRPWYRKKRFTLAGVLAVVVVVIVVSTGSDDDQTASDTTDRTNTDAGTGTTDAGGQEVHGIGEPGTSSDLEITVVSVEDPWVSPNELAPGPDAGRRYIGVELSITNTGDRTATFSTFGSIEVIDAQDRAGDVEPLAITDQPSISGDIPPGASRDGWAYLEVPEDATGVTMRVKGSFTATGALFALD